MLRLTIIEEPDGDKPDSATLVVGPGGATVGRTRENTWVLPDHQNLLSRSHFEILFESGAYRVLDRSTNGTFVNEKKAPIGRGKSAPVQEGDVIGLGEYRIEVTLEAVGTEPEQILGDRPDFFGASSSADAQADLDIPSFTPETDSDGLSGTGDIPDVFAAIEPQQIPDGLFGGSAAQASSVATAGLSDLKQDHGPLLDGSGGDGSDGSDGSLGVPSGPGGERSLDSGLESKNRPGLFVPVVPAPDSTPVQSAYLSAPPMADGRIPEDVDLVAPPSSAVDGNIAGGGIPEDWNLELEDPPPAAPIISPERPAVAPPASAPVVRGDQIAATPPIAQSPPARLPAGDELENGVRRAVSGALGGQAETMDHGELVRVVEEMSAMVQACAPELMRALNSRTQFKDHMRLDQTMVRAQDNNPLKFCSDPGDALSRMLLNDQPGLLQGRLAVAEAFRQLAAHQTALIAALQPALEETVENFSPAAIEAAAREEGGIGFSLSSGKGKLWDMYQQIFARLADSERGRLEEFFMKSLAQHYERCLTTLG